MAELRQMVEKIPVWVGDYYKFITECLGYTKNLEIGWSDLTQEHKELSWFLQFDAHKFKLVLMPRFSLKSCLVTCGYVLWKLINNPNLRVLIYSDNATKSVGFLGDIKNHILGAGSNTLFREYFTNWETDSRDGKWNESQIVIRPREIAQKEPTVDTAGIETSRVGCHYDLIIYDDIVTDLNVTTKAQMDKTYDCYKKSLALLKPGGEVVVVGTRWHFGDAYGRMIQDSSQDFGIFIKKAKEGNSYPFKDIGLTKEFLDGQKDKLGSYLYSCLYLNTPVDDTTALFRHEDYRFYQGEIDTSRLFITCTCDPAGEGEDFTAFTVVGTDQNLRMYVLYASAEHLKPNQIIDRIIKLNYEFKFNKFGIEEKIFNGMLEKELNLALEEERNNKNFRDFSKEIFPATCRKGESKHARILSLQPFHERHALLFPGTTVEQLRGHFGELAYQMMQYTQAHRPVHDDLLDSLAYHIKLIRPGEGEPDPVPKEDTFAGIVEENRLEHNRLQRRVPLKYRKYLEPVF